MITDIIYALKQQGISIWQDQEKLKIASQHDISKSDAVATLKAHKAELLSYLTELNIISKQRFDALTILPAPHSHAPLTLGQKQMYFAQTASDSASTYHIPCLLTLADTCSHSQLAQALKSIITRHSALNSMVSFDETGDPIQTQCHQPIAFEHVSIANTALDTYCKEAFDTPFSLSEQRPFKVTFIDTEHTHYVLLIWHHIAFDGWSLGVFLQELERLYLQQPLARAVQFNDYAYFQASPKQLTSKQDAQQFWYTQLDDLSPLTLAQCQTRPAKFAHQGDTVQLPLDPRLNCKLEALAKHHQVSLNTIGLAAWYHTLALLSGQDNFALGMPSDNRNSMAEQGIIGYFVNTLPIKPVFKHTQSVSSWIAEVNAQINRAKQHQALAFEEIKSLLDIKLDTSMHPVFQSIFTLSQFTPTQTSQHWSVAELPAVDDNQAKFDLAAYLHMGDQPKISLTYATTLYTRCYMKQVAALFQRILCCYADEPAHSQLFELNLLTDHDINHQQHLSGLQSSDFNTPSIVERFHQIVATTPDNIAVSNATTQLSYRALDSKANQLAHLMRKRVPSVRVVAICMQSDIAMVVAMLATLKLGAAYTPLALKDPNDRKRYQLDDSKADLLLYHDNSAQSVAPLLDTHSVIGFEVNEALFFEDGDTSCPFDLPKRTDVANIIYTSGTTGKPKGVAVTHVGCTSLVQSNEQLQFSAHDNFIQLANPAFDAATFEIWGPLLNGAQLHLGYQHILHSPNEFKDTIVRLNISTLWLTRTLFDTMFSQDNAIFHSLTYLLVGGEALTERLVHQLVSSECAPQHFINGYGPTECTTFTTLHTVTAQDTPIPIGKPIPGRAVAVVGQHNQLLPLGCPGELLVSGSGVAAGYIGQPELSNSKFVSCSLWGNASTYYRTGDLVYWNQENQLCYVGRNDEQVKIRGFRVELAGIEQQLNTIDGVKSSAVIARNVHGQTQLHAYIISERRDEQCLTAEAVLQALRPKVASYMLPSTVMFLDTLPLTLNGKLDKRKLPEPQLTCKPIELPSTTTEHNILALWQQILHCDEISVLEPITDYGADSISMLKFCGQARQLGWQLTPQILLEHTSIRELAMVIRDLATQQFAHLNDEEALAQALAHPHFTPSLTFNDSALPMIHMLPAAAGADSFAQLGEELSRSCQLHAVENVKLFTGKHISMQPLVIYYAERILAQQTSGPFFIGGFCEGAMMSLEVANYLSDLGYQVAHCFLIDPVLPLLSSSERQQAEQLVAQSDDVKSATIAEAFLTLTRHFSTTAPYQHDVTFFSANDVSDAAVPLKVLNIIHQVTDIPSLYHDAFKPPCNGLDHILTSVEVVPLLRLHDEIMTDQRDLECIASTISHKLSQAFSTLQVSNA
ncbi:non-ribosomal peptide synthetase [Pseudoalteromonas piscicida]|uniref:Non-ribosomal peptide synthetase n=1 Tax=Pseudoalteromonas piscicida TaxID=43662 RepID=A0A2A5JKS0_PSEO7|nr:non-ribosomal peptide synthetase [Pseudoalteromonas piscicida]PCK30025.1 non-ribosomal peptide synthetase [Pseudoalteromonas piscicida]